MPFDSTDALAAAFDVARSQLTQVDTRCLADPTPCQSWDVRTLVNHIVGAPRAAAGLVAGTPVSNTTEMDFSAGDFRADHDETAEMTLAAFGAPGALDKPVQFPFGERPAAFLMFFVASDQFAHGWDLASALGHTTDLAPGLAADLLEEARAIVTLEMRGAEGTAAFGPEQVAPAGATAADQLAAFLGRTV